MLPPRTIPRASQRCTVAVVVALAWGNGALAADVVSQIGTPLAVRALDAHKQLIGSETVTLNSAGSVGVTVAGITVNITATDSTDHVVWTIECASGAYIGSQSLPWNATSTLPPIPVGDQIVVVGVPGSALPGELERQSGSSAYGIWLLLGFLTWSTMLRSFNRRQLPL
jgi:hypothetical protein